MPFQQRQIVDASGNIINPGAPVLAAGVAHIGEVALDAAALAALESTTAALAASEAHVGQVGGNAVMVAGTLNAVNPGVIAAAGDYAAGDVFSQAVADGTGVHWVFDAIGRVNGGSGLITKAIASCSVEALAARIRLWLFSADPTGSEKDDNAALSIAIADRAKIVGYIDFPALFDAGTVAVSVNPDVRLAFKCGAATMQLFGIAQFLDAVANEAAAMTVSISLLASQD